MGSPMLSPPGGRCHPVSFSKLPNEMCLVLPPDLQRIFSPSKGRWGTPAGTTVIVPASASTGPPCSIRNHPSTRNVRP